jgi:hypothetical protein
MNIFEFWNESSEFPLFLMVKFAVMYECFGLQARFQNELCSQTKVPLYIDTGGSSARAGPILAHPLDTVQYNAIPNVYRS